ncbi:DUF2332 family protein [Novosphingobium sp. FSY-8]|uniref:DUF2332 family protein n=1 Tax=Novosphingobium ovatum TaxID=1908523 RepID=A0ABW9XAW2_9SPHN|nr:DUF2332 domain-containing protein [Novosphingobium ovatum]NBC35666.1 DUF2332 family protein [Novosphingobium ovatum]
MDSGKAIMEIGNVAHALDWQAAHAEKNGAPLTGRVVRAFNALLAGDTQVARRMRDWPGLSLEDAMPLRLAGGFHYLHLTGADARLVPVYSGALVDQGAVDAVIVAVAQTHDAALLPWFDGPPQTNEAGRSAGIMAGLLWLSGRVGPRFDLNEIGASAGANTMIDRYGYDLGGVRVGAMDSPVQIRPEWRGAPPPRADVRIERIAGCDLSPIDLTDPPAALRLKSYVWAEVSERMDRLDAVVALARQQRPDLTRADAADWVEQRLAAPQAEGVCRVLYHSIVWQYIPPAGRARISAAMAAAAARATPERPLAWVRLETNRQTFRHELRVGHWTGRNSGEAFLGTAHAHGAWVEWTGG